MQSFLIEITKEIFEYKAPGSNHSLIDDIKDEARAKGTGKWTTQIAMDLQSPMPTIDSSVSMRDLSKYKELRLQAESLYGNLPQSFAAEVSKEAFLTDLEKAFYFCMVMAYTQGMQMLSNASREFKYDLQLGQIAKIWRGGCIIRSLFLNNIYLAYEKNNNLTQLLLDQDIAALVSEAAPGIRNVLQKTMAAGIATPSFAASLSYFDAFRSGRMPSNLIQAQRDYFGAHTTN